MVGIWLFHDTCISGIFIKQYTCMISNYQSIKNWNNFDIKNYTCGTCFDCRRKGRLLLQCYQRCCCHQSCSPWTSPRVLIDFPVTLIAITWDLNYLVLILINMTNYGHFFWQISSQKSSWFTEKPITEEYAQCPLGEGCWYVSHKPVIRNSDRGLIVCLNVQRFNSSSFPALL